MANNRPDLTPDGRPHNTNEMRTGKNMGNTKPRSRSVHVTVPPEHLGGLKILAQMGGYGKTSTFMERIVTIGFLHWMAGEEMPRQSFADVVEDALARHQGTPEYQIARESVLRAEDRLRGRQPEPRSREQEDGDGIEDVG